MRDRGYQVEERAISVDEIVAAAKGGTLREIIGTGTLSGIEQIGELTVGGKSIVTQHAKQEGPVTGLLRKTLAKIQTGAGEDERGWMLLIDPAARSQNAN